jgi:hypothetical protein
MVNGQILAIDHPIDRITNRTVTLHYHNNIISLTGKWFYNIGTFLFTKNTLHLYLMEVFMGYFICEIIPYLQAGNRLPASAAFLLKIFKLICCLIIKKLHEEF